jgi:intracellular sulfur oxidation DsrE/DsrF family protein
MVNKRRILICTAAAIGGATMTLLLGAPIWGQFQTKVAPSAARSTIERTHRVIIQVTQNDAAVMTLALNNADNLVKYYQDKGEKIQIEFVAFGAGLNMVRSDTSPVKERLAAMNGLKNVTFSGCGNTLANQSRAENKEITLVPEAHLVAAGIARVVELQEQGWSYVRP